MSAAAIIVAAGAGQRFGADTPKQFLPLGAAPVWRWSYDVFAKHPDITEIVIVGPDNNLDQFVGLHAVRGGDTRSQSVLCGLQSLTIADDSPVLIHDAARPGVTASIIDSLLTALETSAAAAPALPINDALKRQSDTLETVDRQGLYRVQTPQAFRLGDIRRALESSETNLVDDLEAIEKQGGNITLVDGLQRLDKITHPSDLKRIGDMLLGQEMRTGSGYDVHAFEPGDHVTLCGVDVSHTLKLKGHSDADAAWHAVTDAILGALALGDIGDHFPPSEEKWKDAPSSIFLKHAAKLAAERGYTIVNIDITIICEAPKIKPHRERMRQSTAECLGLDPDRVSVKATTTEGLGFTGRGEGLAAQANICLARQFQPIR